MSRHFPQQLFVTGTDTDVGKTIVSSILVSGLNASYWKPIQSGLAEQTDTEFIESLCVTPGQIFPEAYRLNTPVSPHASASIDGIVIDLDTITLPQCEETLIVEGAGGVFVPINDNELVIDLIKKLAIPVLVVASNRLGTINHTLLTIAALRDYGCDVFGVVLNGSVNAVNRQSIATYGGVDILAEIEMLDELSPERIQKEFMVFEKNT